MNRKLRRAISSSSPAPARSTAEDLVYSSALDSFQAGQLSQAERTVRQLLAANPRHRESYNLLAVIAFQTFHFAAAAELCRQAIAISPLYADAHCNLGNALHHLGAFEDAITSLRRAIRLKPDSFDAHVCLGDTLRVTGRLDSAIAAYRAAIRLNPQNPDGHFNLSLALLAKGDFQAGWPEHEWRWQTASLKPSHTQFPQPLWTGQPLAGKTLLIHAEQGYGDTVQFCRYVALAAADAACVIVTAPKALTRILQSLPGIGPVLSGGEILPEFDYHCPMLSLPLAFQTTLATIPAHTPYLHPDPAQKSAFAARLAAIAPSGPRIGLVWAGNPRPGQKLQTLIDRRRSLAPDHLAPLLAMPGINFINLQKDGPAAPASFNLIDFMPEMQDFADTAALVANLDLVISVDSAPAHLAGALGCPVWLLDRFDPCWRWLTNRQDSPWYPNLRIYRQPAPGDWHSVISAAASDLAALKA